MTRAQKSKVQGMGLGFLFLAWVGLDFLGLPYFYKDLQDTHAQRIQFSNHIASLKLTQDNFPNVHELIENNFEKNKGDDQKRISFFTQYISQSTQGLNLTVTSLALPPGSSPHSSLTAHIQLQGELSALKKWLRRLENSTTLVDVRGLNLQSSSGAGTPNPFLSYGLSAQLELPNVGGR